RLYRILASGWQAIRPRRKPRQFARDGAQRGARSGEVLVEAKLCASCDAAEARAAPARQLAPGRHRRIAYSHRIAGEGSLGRPRYVATGSCHGGLAAREGKAWLPSACGWAKGKPKHRAYAIRLL